MGRANQRREGTHPWFYSKLAGRVNRISYIPMEALLGSQRGQTLDVSPFPTKATGKGVYGLAANKGHKHFNRPQSDPVNYFFFFFLMVLKVILSTII